MAVASSPNISRVLVALGLFPGGGNYESVRKRIAALKLDASHLERRSKSALLESEHQIRQAVERSRSFAQVLVLLGIEGGGRVQSDLRCRVAALGIDTSLKKRLVDAGLKKARCEICGGHRWNGAPIPLESDHINGRRDDNRLANLRLLCPNCHAQTPTYRGRNVGTANRYALLARVPER